MAAPQDPYECSNFDVDMGTTSSRFLHVELPNAIIDEVAYRTGGDRTDDSRKQPGLARYDHVVFKRGLTGDKDLWNWWKQARDGSSSVDRDVTVRLLNSDHEPVWTWRFKRAFPVNYHTSALDGTRSDIVIEELTLAFDSMDIDQ